MAGIEDKKSQLKGLSLTSLELKNILDRIQPESPMSSRPFVDTFVKAKSSDLIGVHDYDFSSAQTSSNPADQKPEIVRHEMLKSAPNGKFRLNPKFARCTKCNFRFMSIARCATKIKCIFCRGPALKCN